MKVFSRITATVMGNVDELVNKVENHDAVVEAGIKEIRKTAASARVRLARVQKDGKRLHQQKTELKAAEREWLSRAKQVGEQDETRALECLRRRQHCLEKITGLDRTLEEHRVLEEKLSVNVGKIDRRLEEMSLQRNQMKSRQSVADATRVMQSVNATGNLDDTFDRWDSIITESELCAGDLDTESSVDQFATEFDDQEQADKLQAELATLLTKEGGGDE